MARQRNIKPQNKIRATAQPEKKVEHRQGSTKKERMMDYKYIEQLLDKYWACETTPAEERVLRAFFSQGKVPAKLARYKDLFAYEEAQTQIAASTGLSQRLEAEAEKADRHSLTVKMRRAPISMRLRPLIKAAAAVAVVAVIGTAAQHAFNQEPQQKAWDYNAANYKDSYENPQEAYETLDDGIKELKDALISTDNADSLRAAYKADSIKALEK